MSENLSKYVENGIVYIFTHNEFEDYEGPYPDRKKDQERITEHFKTLNFTVNDPYKNYTVDEVKTKVKKISEEFQTSKNDCIIIFVITKFNIRERYLARDGFYTEDDIVNRFKNTAKPVILFSQATTTTEKQIVSTRDAGQSQNDSGLPQEVNFYIVRSFIPYETEPGGYLFVNKLCESLKGKQPLDVEVGNVLQSIKNEIEVQKRTPESIKNKIEVHTPDVTSTMIHTLYLSQEIPSILESIPTYDKQAENGYIYLFNYRFKGIEDMELFGEEHDVNKINESFQNLGFNFHQFKSNSNMYARIEEAISSVMNIDITNIKEGKRKAIETINQIKSVGGDLSKEELENELEKDIDFSPYMCVIVYVLTHGDYNQQSGKNELFTSCYETIDPMDIVNKIQSHESLKGKPKIFIFEACRGHGASKAVNSESPSYNLKDIFRNKILQYDDTLILYSTANTKVSVISETRGSTFTRYFCEELENRTSNNRTASLHDVITATRNRVAQKDSKIDKIQFGDKTGGVINVKQIPVTVSTLTKDVAIKKRVCEQN